MSKQQKEELKVQAEGARPVATLWTAREAYLLAIIALFSGLALGYLIRGSGSAVPVAGRAAAAPRETESATPPATAQSLKPLAEPLLAALQVDPNNFDTLVKLGNLYYDSKVFPEAITYYDRALKLRPQDVNVLTDVGTAYWYSGFPEKAVAEYEKALQVQPTYAQTLFNLGIVRMEGLRDAKAAIAAWEKLLASNPQYPEKQRVQELLAKARSQAG
jgi:cytochrome c-type biogenesis protein CcmH/NrfG